ncbi:hypothetical protein RDABS01_038135 [Bienertia sinuspersici]
MVKLNQFLIFALGLSIGLTIGSFLQTFPLSLTSWPTSLNTTPLPFLTLSPERHPPPPPPPIIYNDGDLVGSHNMSDDELLWRASMVPHKRDQGKTPKVAFMFLTKGPLPLASLWNLFFKGHQNFYSIYVHTHPSFNYSWPPDSVFYGRAIPSQEVEWGTMSMVDAERRLLANALLNFANERFVLLSESCIPLFKFTTIYNYLINSKFSFLPSFDDLRLAGRGRYNPKMHPNIALEDWRKGSQWFEVKRELAIRMVSDQKYYSTFKDHCHPPCYNDEHYFPTLGHILFPDLISNRSVTYVNWSHVGTHVGSHPDRFIEHDITKDFLNDLRFGLSNCTYNGNLTTMCFLFARKFVGDTLKPLLEIAPKILF